MITSTGDGKRNEKNTANLGTSLTVITDTLSTRADVESVEFCNKTAGAITVDLVKTSGSTDFYYLKGFQIAANTSYAFKDHVIVLQASDTLKALASATTSIDVSVTYMQAT